MKSFFHWKLYLTRAILLDSGGSSYIKKTEYKTLRKNSNFIKLTMMVKLAMIIQDVKKVLLFGCASAITVLFHFLIQAFVGWFSEQNGQFTSAWILRVFFFFELVDMNIGENVQHIYIYDCDNVTDCKICKMFVRGWQGVRQLHHCHIFNLRCTSKCKKPFNELNDTYSLVSRGVTETSTLIEHAQNHKQSSAIESIQSSFIAHLAIFVLIVHLLQGHKKVSPRSNFWQTTHIVK